MIKKNRAVVGLLVFGLLLGGCSLVVKPANVTTETPTVNIFGVVHVAGEQINIDDGKFVTIITSRKIDLKQYDGKQVTVTGEFSGTTLFVDSVK